MLAFPPFAAFTRLAAAVLLPSLVLVGASCRDDEQSSGKGPDRSDTTQSAATLAELAREAGVPFPAAARLIGVARENGMDDLLRFKVEIPASDLAAFLATSPVPSEAFEAGERGLLGPDQGFWDPRRAQRLRTGQQVLPGQRALNIGIDDGRPDVVSIYVVNHGT
jgi:hypothetical protein